MSNFEKISKALSAVAYINLVEDRCKILDKNPNSTAIKNIISATILYKIFNFFRNKSKTKSNLPNQNKSTISDYFLRQDIKKIGWVLEKKTNGDKDSIMTCETNNNKLIIVHCYYYDLLEDILNILDDYKEYDIVFTTSNNDIYQRLCSEGKINIMNILLPNKGRDVFPFTYVISHINLNKYKYFIKLHSKKSKHLKGQGLIWGYKNLNMLVGNKKHTETILSLINEDIPTLIGTDLLPMHDHYANNKHWLNYLTKGACLNNHLFIPGTMFIGNIQALKIIEKESLWLGDYEEEMGQLDGCLAHALERYMCYVVEENKGYVAKTRNILEKYISSL
ncbi:hypothetical protein OAM25_02500 [Gammaproteobacteria bacterium]|nr:hypothetical protein [Gammaproteobacteria bacterium]